MPIPNKRAVELAPRSLGVPLQRKPRLGLVLIGTCLVLTGVLWVAGSPFAVVFFASCLVGLPVLGIAVLAPRKWPRMLAAGRWWWMAALVLYLALAKTVLVPMVVALLHGFTAWDAAVRAGFQRWT